MSALRHSSALKLGVPTFEDVDSVCANIRESDRRDMQDLHPGKSITEIIMGDVGYSEFVYGLYFKDSIQGLFGVVPMAPAVGTPWLVGTIKVDETPLPFARASRGLLDMLQRTFPLLETWVCARNSKSVTWHKWCGFQFEKETVCLGRDDYYRARRCLKNINKEGS